MIKTILACSVLCLTSQMLLAQQSILLEPIKITEEYSTEIRQSINDFKIVRLDFNVLRNIASNNKGSLDFHLRVGDDYDWKISLEENNIKSPNYRIEENNKQFDGQLQTVTTYKIQEFGTFACRSFPRDTKARKRAKKLSVISYL